MKNPKRNQFTPIASDHAKPAAIVSRHVQLPVTKVEDAAAFAMAWGPTDMATPHVPSPTPARVTRASAVPEPDKGSVAEPVN